MEEEIEIVLTNATGDEQIFITRESNPTALTPRQWFEQNRGTRYDAEVISDLAEARVEGQVALIIGQPDSCRTAPMLTAIINQGEYLYVVSQYGLGKTLDLEVFARTLSGLSFTSSADTSLAPAQLPSLHLPTLSKPIACPTTTGPATPAMATAAICPDADMYIPTEGTLEVPWGCWHNTSQRPCQSYYPGGINHPHQGIDIFGSSSPGVTPVYATFNGIAHREGSAAVYIVFDVPHNGQSAYMAHMKNQATGEDYRAVSDGQRVSAGSTLIGKQGNYGGDKAVVPHLHISYVKNNRGWEDWSQSLDPTQFLQANYLAFYSGWNHQGPITCKSAPTLPPYQNLVQNGDFSGGYSPWWKGGDADWAIQSDQILRFKRTMRGGGGSVGQNMMSYDVPAGTPFEIVLDLGNSSNVVKQPLVSLHHPDGTKPWDIQCRFTLPPNTPLHTYRIRGRSTFAWNGINFEVSPDPADNIADVLMDNVSVTYRPDINPTGTECSPFNQPPNVPNLLVPADGGAVLSKNVTLSVQDTGDPDNYPNTWRDFYWHIEKDDGSWSQDTGWNSSTSWSVTLPSIGTYRWAVWSGDGGTDSGMSEWHTFTVGRRVYLPAVLSGSSAAFSSVSLAPIANNSMDHLATPLVGRVTLGGIPFDFAAGDTATFATQDAGEQGRPTEGVLNVYIPQPKAVHVLLGGGWTLAQFRNAAVGTITLSFSDGQALVVPVIPGFNLRENWGYDDSSYNQDLVMEASGDPNWSNVYGEMQGRGDQPATAFIDLLTIPVPAAYQTATLTQITIRDTSAQTVSHLSPSLHIYAISVAHQP